MPMMAMPPAIIEPSEMDMMGDVVMMESGEMMMEARMPMYNGTRYIDNSRPAIRPQLRYHMMMRERRAGNAPARMGNAPARAADYSRRRTMSRGINFDRPEIINQVEMVEMKTGKSLEQLRMEYSETIDEMREEMMEMEGEMMELDKFTDEDALQENYIGDRMDIFDRPMLEDSNDTLDAGHGLTNTVEQGNYGSTLVEVNTLADHTN